MSPALNPAGRVQAISVADPADAGSAAANAIAKTAANRTACRARYRRPRRAITGKIIAEIAAFRRAAPAGMAARGAVRYHLWALAAGEGHGKSAHPGRRYRRHRREARSARR